MKIKLFNIIFVGIDFFILLAAIRLINEETSAVLLVALSMIVFARDFKKTFLKK